MVWWIIGGAVMLACIVADWLIVMGCNPKRWRCRK